MKTEICKLYSRVLKIFVPNIMIIYSYNFELYRFKVGSFLKHSVVMACRLQGRGQEGSRVANRRDCWCVTETITSYWSRDASTPPGASRRQTIPYMAVIITDHNVIQSPYTAVNRRRSSFSDCHRPYLPRHVTCAPSSQLLVMQTVMWSPRCRL